MLEAYESVRHQITRFDEMPPKERKELFERVWKLIQHVESGQDSFPKPGVALLHDALTHAALFFIEVYERERERSPDGPTEVDPAKLEAVEQWGKLRLVS